MSAGTKRPLGEIHRGERLPIVLMLLLALALFLAGLFRPFTQVTKLWVFDHDVSVYQRLDHVVPRAGTFPVWHPLLVYGDVSRL